MLLYPSAGIHHRVVISFRYDKQGLGNTRSLGSRTRTKLIFIVQRFPQCFVLWASYRVFGFLYDFFRFSKDEKEEGWVIVIPVDFILAAKIEALRPHESKSF